jgi:formyl-CoA transferase
MAGPFSAMLLADLGADVVKVEPPGGDSTRQMPGAVGHDTPAFNAVNRGKRSIVVNLKTQEGRGIVSRLALASDILIENYRPGVMESFGFGYDELAGRNPRLIYASVSGYGQTGPSRSKGGFDLIAQGVSGIMSVTGDPDGPPVKAGVPLTDLGAGLFAVVGILAALQGRHRTGLGQHRYVARRFGSRALGVGGDRILLRIRRPRRSGIRASDERALPGDSMLGRIHHAGRSERAHLSQDLRRPRSPGVGL